MPSPTTIANKRTAMFAMLGNNAVWDKNDPTTLIFAILDAYAKEFGNHQDTVDGVHNDLSLTTANRIDNLQALWGSVLQENLQGDLSVMQNITSWLKLLQHLITGTVSGGVTYQGSHRINIRQIILDFSLVAECKVFEFWSDAATFIGSDIASRSLIFNNSAHSWNQGPNSEWVDIDTLRRLSFLPSAFLIMPEITGYTRDTALIPYAANILKPVHNIFGICWCLNTAAMAFFPNIGFMQIGTGNSGGGGGCSSPVAVVPAFLDYVDVHKRVSVTPTPLIRASAVFKISDLPNAEEITEAILQTNVSAPIASTYQTFSAIHHVAGDFLSMAYYIPQL